MSESLLTDPCIAKYLSDLVFDDAVIEANSSSRDSPRFMLDVTVGGSSQQCLCIRKRWDFATALALLLTCLSSLRCLALDPAKDIRQYVLRTWTTEQGLPQNTIHAMLQTRDGFLWIGTRGGLARFDGSRFILHKAGEPNSVPGESITGLVEDRDGSLWISSEGGLTQYRNGIFRTYTSRDGLPDNSIWRIAADNAGGVWAVTWRSQLFQFRR